MISKFMRGMWVTTTEGGQHIKNEASAITQNSNEKNIIKLEEHNIQFDKFYEVLKGVSTSQNNTTAEQESRTEQQERILGTYAKYDGLECTSEQQDHISISKPVDKMTEENLAYTNGESNSTSNDVKTIKEGDLFRVLETKYGKEYLFTATPPEIDSVRSELLTNFPIEMLEEAGFTDAYLLNVMTAPKDGEQRTRAYALGKLQRVLEWRQTYMKQQKEIPTSAVFHSEVLGVGSLYWRGYDSRGRPILWARPMLKNWEKLNVNDEIELHRYLIDCGIQKMMTEHITQFVLVADATGMGMFNGCGFMRTCELMQQLLKLLTEVYPDRLHSLHVGPISPFVSALAVLLFKVVPSRVAAKIILHKDPKLEIVMPRFVPVEIGNGTCEEPPPFGSTEVPDFFHGPCHHKFGSDGYQEHEEFSMANMIKYQRREIDKNV